MASYDDRERIYHKGYRDGFKDGIEYSNEITGLWTNPQMAYEEKTVHMPQKKKSRSAKPNSWTRFLKANSPKPWARYKSGPKKGLIKMKEMSRRYRKKKR